MMQLISTARSRDGRYRRDQTEIACGAAPPVRENGWGLKRLNGGVWESIRGPWVTN